MASLTGAPSHEPSIVEWGWAGRALEEPSGDRHVVVPFPGGVLVGLLDGLGHGIEAAAACAAAVPVLEAHAREAVAALVQRCHDALRKTRGVVMTLASFTVHDSAMTWIAVGNVSAVLLRRRPTPDHRNEAIAVRGGVVGYQLPSLRASTFVVSSGDTLILASDGIREAFTTGTIMAHSPQEIAESILARFARPSDDAHVVVARYVGAAP
jgi:phosphoserine phosphatase RsbX